MFSHIFIQASFSIKNEKIKPKSCLFTVIMIYNIHIKEACYQQINHPIYFKSLAMICVAINNHQNKKNPYILRKYNIIYYYFNKILFLLIYL